jgi:hypothetical protein
MHVEMNLLHPFLWRKRSSGTTPWISILPGIADHLKNLSIHKTSDEENSTSDDEQVKDSDDDCDDENSEEEDRQDDQE